MPNDKSTAHDDWWQSSYPEPELNPRNALALFVALMGLVLIALGIWGALRHGDWWYDHRGIGSAPPLEAILPLLVGIVVVIVATLLYSSAAPVLRPAAAIYDEGDVVIIPPHAIALAELAALEVADLLPRGDFAAHYAAVSTTLRYYLGDSYGFLSLDMTTSEIIAQLTARDLPAAPVEVCHQLLHECDLVKFAQYHPALSEARKLIPRVRAFIETMETVN